VHEDRPSEILRVLNAALLREGRERGDFCTAVYVRLDTGGPMPSMCVSVAGHPAPLLHRDGDGVTAVGRPGTMLGVVDEPVLHDQQLDLSAGDLLLLYTDGLVESRTADGRFGTERLVEILDRVGDRPVDEVVRRVEEAMTAGEHVAEDDVAMLALRIGG
jgi:serine phosphatase RsbU (regulator of sigma subunit)